MTGRTPWYFVPRSMGPWQSHLMAIFMPLCSCGIGFIFGWSLVRFPGKTDDETMPAPAWLFWIGLGCMAAGLLAFAVARLTSPADDGESASLLDQPTPVRSGCVGDLTCAALLGGSLAVCSIVSSSSTYRWRPIWAIVGMTICLPIVLYFSRNRS